jgi:hypothetical protein
MVLPVPNPTKCFWIEAAESPLRDFRSTPELPEEADVVVVGSGYAGATAAYWVDKVGSDNLPMLLQRMRRCLLVD